MFANLEKSFEKIGAKVEVVVAGNGRRVNSRRARQFTPARLNIINKKGKELFEIELLKDTADKIDLTVLEVVPKDRHLVLLAKVLDENGDTVRKDHFLCGHDERHLFVASVQSVSTVAGAKASLKPEEIRNNEIGLNSKKRNRRKTEVFKRQGEWFFIPTDIGPKDNFILKDEFLVRGGGGKPHIAQFAFRTGGESVYVCSKYPNGLTEREYEVLLKGSPKSRHLGWRRMVRNPGVYVKGRVKHADHATIVLDCWHRVMINTEIRGNSIGFLD